MIEDFVTESHVRLRLMREAVCLSKREFAALLKVNYRTYTRWEKFEMRPSMKAQHEMINIGLNPNYLIGDKELIMSGISFETVRKKVIEFQMGESLCGQ